MRSVVGARDGRPKSGGRSKQCLFEFCGIMVDFLMKAEKPLLAWHFRPLRQSHMWMLLQEGAPCGAKVLMLA